MGWRVSVGVGVSPAAGRWGPAHDRPGGAGAAGPPGRRRESGCAVRPPFPYYGGKMSTAAEIVDLLPEHRHYVEPYAGSLSVLLAKAPAPFETVNDLHAELMTFWRVLRDR